jgi:hypothetical protein
LFPINKCIILVLWFHILCCSIVILCSISVFCYYNSSCTLQVVSEHFPWQKIVGYFFQGRDVFRRLKATKICRSMHKYVVREAYMQELQVVLERTVFATLVTPIGTPSSGSASNNTCIRIDLDILKPFVDKSIGRRTVIMPLRTTLRKILFSTWVIW